MAQPFRNSSIFRSSKYTKNRISKEKSSIMGNDDKHDASLGGTGAPGEAAYSHGFLTFEGENASSTIYYVPSFLLKTYEIVDVRFQS
jgi:hypothetical protein